MFHNFKIKTFYSKLAIKNVLKTYFLMILQIQGFYFWLGNFLPSYKLFLFFLTLEKAQFYIYFIYQVLK